MGIIIDAKLIRHGQKQRVGLCDSFVFCELLDQDVRLCGIAAAKNGSRVVAEKPDSVLALVLLSEISAIAVVYECEDAAADGHPRLACITSCFPRLTEYPNLLRLLYVKRTSALIVFECRTLQIHSMLGCPGSSRIRTGAPPDSIAQTL